MRLFDFQIELENSVHLSRENKSNLFIKFLIFFKLYIIYIECDTLK